MQGEYVAIDLHRWRSVIVREEEGGRELGVTRIDNSPLALSQAVGEAGPCPQVAIEATAGWYWAVDVLMTRCASQRGPPARRVVLVSGDPRGLRHLRGRAGCGNGFR